MQLGPDSEVCGNAAFLAAGLPARPNAPLVVRGGLRPFVTQAYVGGQSETAKQGGRGLWSVTMLNGGAYAGSALILLEGLPILVALARVTLRGARTNTHVRPDDVLPDAVLSTPNLSCVVERISTTGRHGQ